MKRIIDKQTKLFIRDDFDFNRQTEIGLDVEPAQGFYKPKWETVLQEVKNESGYVELIEKSFWIEGATQEYIDSLKTQPQEPTEAERLEALEMLMVDILGGGF